VVREKTREFSDRAENYEVHHPEAPDALEHLYKQALAYERQPGATQQSGSVCQVKFAEGEYESQTSQPQSQSHLDYSGWATESADTPAEEDRMAAIKGSGKGRFGKGGDKGGKGGRDLPFKPRPGEPRTDDCWNCGKSGHMARDCPDSVSADAVRTVSGAQLHRQGVPGTTSGEVVRMLRDKLATDWFEEQVQRGLEEEDHDQEDA
jgi:hypothetical protein